MSDVTEVDFSCSVTTLQKKRMMKSLQVFRVFIRFDGWLFLSPTESEVWFRPGSEESDEMRLKTQNVSCVRKADVVFRRIKFTPQRKLLLSEPLVLL